MTVHVFQIGCQDIGRLGFERFLQFEEYFPVDVNFEGVHCKDFEAEERARKFAESTGKDLKVFEGTNELYKAAQEVDGEVMIYDAGPPQLHGRNIAESIRMGFHHLTEKPPSVTREQHIKERKLASSREIRYKVDFIERENPVIEKIQDIAKEKDIEEVKVFRESSFGVQKVLRPLEFSHVRGGCVLDKMSNEIYVLDLLENDLELEDCEIEFLMPKNLGGEKVVQTDGSSSNEVTEETSIGKCTGRFSSGDTELELNASWLGLSEESHAWDKKIREKFGEILTENEHRELDEKSFQDEECRFLVIKGERTIVGDLLHQRIFDMDSEEEVQVPEFPRDQLYRVLEKAVLDAAGVEEYMTDEEEVDVFMNALFDLQSQVEGEIYEEVDKASEKIRSMVSSDKDFSPERELEGVAR